MEKIWPENITETKILKYDENEKNLKIYHFFLMKTQVKSNILLFVWLKNENEMKLFKNQYEKENNDMKMKLQFLTKIKSCILKDGRNIILYPKSVVFSIKYN